MVKNKTRKKPENAWVSLCLVTKQLANWGELLSGRPEVRILSGTLIKNSCGTVKYFSCFFIFRINFILQIPFPANYAIIIGTPFSLYLSAVSPLNPLSVMMVLTSSNP